MQGWQSMVPPPAHSAAGCLLLLAAARNTAVRLTAQLTASVGHWVCGLIRPHRTVPHRRPQDFRAVFIRAPAVLELGAGVEQLAAYTLTSEEAAGADGRTAVTVAVRSGSLMATAFHPELTSDLRWCVTCTPCMCEDVHGGVTAARPMLHDRRTHVI